MKTAFPRILPALLALAILALALGGIVDHDLWTPDEPRVCCISKTMWQTRDWAVPRLAGEIFIEKPPLYFWLCGACGEIFGPLFGHVGGARLSCSLCALGTLAAGAWLAFLLRGRRRHALYAVLVLATMPQFILEMHWMRTDVLLAFFVAAAVAFLVLAYRHGRPWALLPAGLAAAGAFLAKGPIGWILIAPAALPLALHAFLSERGGTGRKPWIAAHLLAAALALGLSALWVVAIYRHPDPGAWKAWFWDNQVGRTTGTATALGHHNPWAVHYYLVLLPVVLGPWFPHLCFTVARGLAILRAASLRDHWRDLLQSPSFLLAAWGFGGLLLLTIPSTKRGIYLLPLYPAFALLAADAVPRATHRVFRVWTGIWETLAALLAAGILLLPALARLLPPDFALPPAAGPLVHWTACHTATLLLGLLWMVLRRPFRAAHDAASHALRLFLANVFLWLTVFGVPFRAVDAGKSMREATLRFAAELPSDTSRTAAFRLDETARADLEYYAGVVFPPAAISPWTPPGEAAEYVDGILSGKNPDFSSVVVAARHDRDKFWPPEAEAVRGRLGGKRHVYFLAPAVPAPGEDTGATP